LIPCPFCNRHAKSTETLCPFCNEPLRLPDLPDGSVPRTKVAVLLGLTAAGALAVLGETCMSRRPPVMPAYGAAMTTGKTSGGTGDGGVTDGGTG
jgi:hypothetical protein